MNLPPDLLCLLEEWSGLSLTEEAAIAARDWTALAQCHVAKDRLQTQISSFPDSDGWLHSRPGQDWIGRLLAQEQKNAAHLAAQRQAAEASRAEGQMARRHLRQIHGAYSSRQPTRWHSYS